MIWTSNAYASRQKKWCADKDVRAHVISFGRGFNFNWTERTLLIVMFSRHANTRIREALADTRVVLLAGPRQAGKTTLARSLADEGMRYLTLDDVIGRTVRTSRLGNAITIIYNLFLCDFWICYILFCD